MIAVRFKGYGVVPADSRFVYFPMKDTYELLVSETGVQIAGLML